MTKKLNLARINKQLWPYEDETYKAKDADSFEEAQQAVDKYYAEREGYFRGLSEAAIKEEGKKEGIDEEKGKTVSDSGTDSEQEIHGVMREPEILNNPGETAGPPKEFN